MNSDWLYGLIGGVLIGIALLLQSTLGDFLAHWRQRLQEWLTHSKLAWLRKRERKSKEKSRRRVMAKHLERAAEREKHEAKPVEAAEQNTEASSAPMRVTEKSGEGGFAMRRVRVKPPTPVKPKAKPKPQREIPFAKDQPTSTSLPPLNLLQLDPVETLPRGKIEHLPNRERLVVLPRRRGKPVEPHGRLPDWSAHYGHQRYISHPGDPLS